jgi:hypothetical protein
MGTLKTQTKLVQSAMVLVPHASMALKIVLRALIYLIFLLYAFVQMENLAI